MMGLIIPRPDVPIKFACALCDAVFTEDERHQYERHVLGHPIEDVQALSPRHQAPVLFGNAGGDEDWSRWVAEHRISDPHGWARWGKTGDGKSSSGVGDG